MSGSAVRRSTLENELENHRLNEATTDLLAPSQAIVADREKLMLLWAQSALLRARAAEVMSLAMEARALSRDMRMKTANRLTHVTPSHLKIVRAD
jgi:hypothetical protein